MSDLGNKEIMSKNIVYYMNLRGVDRYQLADAVGRPYTTITDWIKGNTYPRIDSIEKMSNFFCCRKSDLVEEHNEDSEDEQVLRQYHDRDGVKTMFYKTAKCTDEELEKANAMMDAFLKTLGVDTD